VHGGDASCSDRLFVGPHNARTLEGQYVIKDIILVASGFVVASTLPGLVPGTDAAPSTAAPTATDRWRRRGDRSSQDTGV